MMEQQSSSDHSTLSAFRYLSLHDLVTKKVRYWMEVSKYW